MRWYEGGIAEAVAASKIKGAVFVVFIEGQDPKSKELGALIETNEVSAKLANDHFVAIKVEANSVTHQQFSQIYPAVTVPSVFFIGKNGVTIEILVEVKDSTEFINKIEQVTEKHFTKLTEGQLSENLIKNEQKTEEAASTSTATPEVSPEEKIERAKELIEKKREEKKVEAEETEKAKELERRKMGQNVQKMKQQQEDQELKQLMEERQKAKRDEQAARQRVLAQIAQDKAERASKFAPSSSQTPQTQPNLPVRPPVNNTVARLNFKLPNGSSHTHQFSNTDTLLIVRNFIIANLQLPYRNFTLSTTFPRREFLPADNEKTLEELGLVPTALILILPLNQGTVSTHANTWGIRNFIFGAPRQNPGPSQDNKRSADVAEARSSPPQKKRFGESTVIRRQGNVHRLSDNKDSDEDENNTWNGNSTQQM